MAQQEIERVIKKIEFQGSGRNQDHYEVADKLISIETQTKLDYKKGWHTIELFHCTCKDCAVTRIPNHLEPRCIFVKALKEYRKRFGLYKKNGENKT